MGRIAFRCLLGNRVRVNPESDAKNGSSGIEGQLKSSRIGLIKALLLIVVLLRWLLQYL